MTTKRKSAAIYVRISQDRAGAALGVQRQEKECRETAEELGWTVTAVYSDNDKSASNRKKPRPHFERMMAALRAGEHDAVVCWHTDRLTRQPMELEHFIILAEDHGVGLATVHSGEADLLTDDGQMTARLNGTLSARESKTKQRRAIGKHRQLREAGKRRGGPRPFGWGVDTGVRRWRNEQERIVWDYSKTVPEEADLIRSGVKAILDGESLTSVTKLFNASGLTPTIGRVRRAGESDEDFERRCATAPAWSLQSVKKTLTRYSNAGVIEHEGKPVEGVAADWEPIISREDLEAVREALSSATVRIPMKSGEVVTVPRRSNAGRQQRHLLTGILTCSACWSTMQYGTVPQAGRKVEVYRCANRAGGCWMSVEYHTANAVVMDHVVAELSKPHAELLGMNDADHLTIERLQEQARALDTEEEQVQAANISFAARLAELERVHTAREAVETELMAALGRVRMHEVIREQVAIPIVERDGKKFAPFSLAAEARQEARQEAMRARLTDDEQTPLAKRRTIIRALCRPVVQPVDRSKGTGLSREEKTRRRIVCEPLNVAEEVA